MYTHSLLRDVYYQTKAATMATKIKVRSSLLLFTLWADLGYSHWSRYTNQTPVNQLAQLDDSSEIKCPAVKPSKNFDCKRSNNNSYINTSKEHSYGCTLTLLFDDCTKYTECMSMYVYSNPAPYWRRQEVSE